MYKRHKKCKIHIFCKHTLSQAEVFFQIRGSISRKRVKYGKDHGRKKRKNHRGFTRLSRRSPGCACERYIALSAPLWPSRSPLASASAPAPGKRQRRLLTYAPWRENQRTKLRKADSRKYRRGRGGERVFRGCTAPFLGQSADLRQKIYQNLGEFGLRFGAGFGVKFRENTHFWKELFSIVNFIKRPKIGIWKSREN